jgi:uracil-DNA glycosylase
MQDIVRLIQRDVFPFQSVGTLFNFYSGNNSNSDKGDGYRIRQDNLLQYIGHFTSKPKALLIGEAPGHLGCRYSGVPMTSERQLTQQLLRFNGSQSSTRLSGHAEGTATMFWSMCRNFDCFVWNAVPFHPHKAGQIASNRTPTAQEIAACSSILKSIVDILQPTHVAALGDSATDSLTALNIPHTCIRHPAHGGKSDFTRGIRWLQCQLP